MSLHLGIVTPKGAVLDREVEEVTLPGKLGEFGVLDGHIPFLSALRPGCVRYRVGSEWQRLAVGSGFVEVGAARKVLVLTDSHALPEQVDADETARELAELEAELKGWAGEITVEHEELSSRAAWARARLELKAETRTSSPH